MSMTYDRCVEENFRRIWEAHEEERASFYLGPWPGSCSNPPLEYRIIGGEVQCHLISGWERSNSYYSSINHSSALRAWVAEKVLAYHGLKLPEPKEVVKEVEKPIELGTCPETGQSYRWAHGQIEYQNPYNGRWEQSGDAQVMPERRAWLAERLLAHYGFSASELGESAQKKHDTFRRDIQAVLDADAKN